MLKNKNAFLFVETVTKSLTGFNKAMREEPTFYGQFMESSEENMRFLAEVKQDVLTDQEDDDVKYYRPKDLDDAKKWILNNCNTKAKDTKLALASITEMIHDTALYFRLDMKGPEVLEWKRVNENSDAFPWSQFERMSLIVDRSYFERLINKIKSRQDNYYWLQAIRTLLDESKDHSGVLLHLFEDWELNGFHNNEYLQWCSGASFAWHDSLTEDICYLLLHADTEQRKQVAKIFNALSKSKSWHEKVQINLLSKNAPESNLSNYQYAQLVSTCLSKKTRWIYRNLVEAARKTKLSNWPDVNALVELDQMRLIHLKKKEKTYSVILTEAGKETIKIMPDNLGEVWFPLPSEIALAKSIISNTTT